MVLAFFSNYIVFSKIEIINYFALILIAIDLGFTDFAFFTLRIASMIGTALGLNMCQKSSFDNVQFL